MSIPSPEHFVLTTPLYEKIDLVYGIGPFLFDLQHTIDKLDSYCPDCEKQTTFSREVDGLLIGHHSNPRLKSFEEIPTDYKEHFLSHWLNNNVITLSFKCSRNNNHIFRTDIYCSKNFVMKIGQYPSIADTTLPELKKYRKVLSEDKYKEFTKSIGLVSHGVGIGAYVYLRRIFEDLIEEAHETLKQQANWDEGRYQQAKMGERIELLDSELPEFMVANTTVYGILSKGIHELSEDECLRHFDILRLAIELMLEEKLHKKQRAEKAKNAAAALNKIHQEIKTNDKR